MSRYRRPRMGISWLALLLGAALGAAAGLSYAWVLNPAQEVNVAPWQMNRDARDRYLVAVILDYSYTGDLGAAVDRLITLMPPDAPADPIDLVAETACRLASSGYVDSSAGLRAIRALMNFYQLQGRASCADELIPADVVMPTQMVGIVAPTPTLAPPATKTPTPDGGGLPTPTPRGVIVPTTAPQATFALVRLETFCDPLLPAVLEVYVQDSGGDGIAGIAVRVLWSGGQDTFFTGLMPERGPAYADFQMQPDVAYTLELVGRSNPSQRPIAAVPCTTELGEASLTSYRAVFRPAG